MRGMVSCFKDPSIVIKEAYKSLLPGGWLEMQDPLFPMGYATEPPIDSAISKWCSLFIEAAQKAGRPLTNVQHYARWMKEIGFVDVEVRNFYWPTNEWCKGKHLKAVSRLFQEDFLENLDGVSMKLFTGVLGWSVDELNTFVAGVRKDFEDPTIHAYMTM